MSTVTPGKYIAKPISGKFSKSKDKGTPCVVVYLEFETKEKTVETLFWTGWMSPAALERTCENLALLGYDDSKGNDVEGNIPMTSFDPFTTVEITVEDESYTNESGKTFTKSVIKWINKPGGSSFQTLQAGEVSNMLASVNIRGQMAAARAKLGLDKKAAPVKNYAPGAKNAPPEPPNGNNTEPVPF